MLLHCKSVTKSAKNEQTKTETSFCRSHSKCLFWVCDLVEKICWLKDRRSNVNKSKVAGAVPGDHVSCGDDKKAVGVEALVSGDERGGISALRSICEEADC